MKLKKLIKNIPELQLKGSKEIAIGSVIENSTLVSPGALFISKDKNPDKAALHITEAISAGAAAIVTDIYNPILKDTVQLIHPRVNEIASLLAAEFYSFPSRELFTIGITGTNGKTTTSFLIKHMLDCLQRPCGLIGTIEYIIGNHRYRATHTTPDACTNQKFLREMLLQGCTSAVMEVSSHALNQGRVNDIDFDIALFTNLSPEHLDYHQNMESYAKAKKQLFLQLAASNAKDNKFPKMAISNSDSPWHEYMTEGLPFISYGIDSAANITAFDISLKQTCTEFTLQYEGQAYPCCTPLIGRHNIYNVMAAIAVGITKKYSLKQLISIMEKAPQVPGRLQPVPNELGISIYVDFAHTEDALMNVLSTLQQLKTARIITLFGCGGDRDREKRPKMAEAAERLSDFLVITSDNPRSEDPQAICEQIIKGLSPKAEYCIELDRKKAIAYAIAHATQGDIILIAGKGHEYCQIFKHQTIEFNDYAIAAALCKETYSGIRST